MLIDELPYGFQFVWADNTTAYDLFVRQGTPSRVLGGTLAEALRWRHPYLAIFLKKFEPRECLHFREFLHQTV